MKSIIVHQKCIDEREVGVLEEISRLGEPVLLEKRRRDCDGFTLDMAASSPVIAIDSRFTLENSKILVNPGEEVVLYGAYRELCVEVVAQTLIEAGAYPSLSIRGTLSCR